MKLCSLLLASLVVVTANGCDAKSATSNRVSPPPAGASRRAALRPAPRLLSHLRTWVYDGGFKHLTETDGTHAVSNCTIQVSLGPMAVDSCTNAASRALVQAWVSYADIGLKAFADCPQGSSCLAGLYTGGMPVCGGTPAQCPSRVLSRTWINSYNNVESAWLHYATPIAPSNRIVSIYGDTTYWAYKVESNEGVDVASDLTSDFPLIYSNTNTFIHVDNTVGNCREWIHTTWPVELGGPGPLRGISNPACDSALVRSIQSMSRAWRWPNGTPVKIWINGLYCSQFYGSSPYPPVYDPALYTVVNPGSGGANGNVIGIQDERQTEYNHIQDSVWQLGAACIVNDVSLMYGQNSASIALTAVTDSGAKGSTQGCTDTSSSGGGYGASCGFSPKMRWVTAFEWMLLTPDLHSPVSFDDFGAPKADIDVYPIQQIVPTNPIVTMTPFDTSSTDPTGCATGSVNHHGGLSDYVVACGLTAGSTHTGIYIREFAGPCYSFGVAIAGGKGCAVVWNCTDSAVTVSSSWFSGATTFTHSLALPTDNSTQTVLAEGCSTSTGCSTSIINPRGASFTMGTTEVPAYDALFLFP